MTTNSYRISSLLCIGLCFALLWVTGSAAAVERSSDGTGRAGRADDDARFGWHKELMPTGLVKGARHGEYLWQRDGAVMVYIPAGAFVRGSETGAGDERPQREIQLAAYYIDRSEVTWGQWKSSGLEFSDNTHERRPVPFAPDWGIHDDQPVIYVTWHDAKRYAERVGKRLPSEAQWEKAARGPEGRTFPWGEEPVTEERAIWRGHPLALESTASADCCVAGASPYGVLNMAGNVYEWCDDLYHPGYYRISPDADPRNQQRGRFRVLRGGAFPLEAADLRSSARYRLLPEDRTPYIGFRTVLPVAE